jgi:hypothetical protein
MTTQPLVIPGHPQIAAGDHGLLRPGPIGDLSQAPTVDSSSSSNTSPPCLGQQEKAFLPGRSACHLVAKILCAHKTTPPIKLYGSSHLAAA